MSEVLQPVNVSLTVRDSLGNAWCPGASCYHDPAGRAAQPCLSDDDQNQWLGSGLIKVCVGGRQGLS